MTTLAQMGNDILTHQSLIPLLARHQLIPQLLYDLILDRAIAPITCTFAETAEACQQFYQERSLTTEVQQQDWRSHYGLSQTEVEQLATRSLRIEKLKQAKWGHKLQSYFLKRKDDLDQVIYSLLRTKDQDLAQELYFRIHEREQPFAELARQYSEGAEAETGGLLGRVELGMLHFKLATLLRTLPIGQVETLVLGNRYMLVRLEKRIPASLDEAMRQRLLQEKFEAWLHEQAQSLPTFDQLWLGRVPQPTEAAIGSV